MNEELTSTLQFLAAYLVVMTIYIVLFRMRKLKIKEGMRPIEAFNRLLPFIVFSIYIGLIGLVIFGLTC